MCHKEQIYFSVAKIDDSPPSLLRIQSPTSKKFLTLDISGDTLRVSGTLDYDEAAKIFFDALGRDHSREIRELRKRIRELENKSRLDDTCLCDPNVEMYAETIIRCAECHKEAKTARL